MTSLEELGSQAYQKGLWGDYKGAISILTKAILKYPYDRRLYNDRCYYYYKNKDYKSALIDAENMLRLFPTYTRGHFRKGEVLLELKRYDEAEIAFSGALKLDPTNGEIKYHLLEAQLCQLTQEGRFWMIDALKALQLNNYNTDQAKAFLSIGGLANTNNYCRNEIYYSDEEIDVSPPTVANTRVVLTPKTFSKRSETPTPVPKASHFARSRSVSCSRPTTVRSTGVGLSVNDPCTDPNNPFKSNALWVGNITKRITDKMLESLFSKYGRIKSIVVQHQNHCAFVNYTQYTMASTAMRNFPQKYPIEDTFLVIRFPDSSKVRKVANFSKKI